MHPGRKTRTVLVDLNQQGQTRNAQYLELESVPFLPSNELLRLSFLGVVQLAESPLDPSETKGRTFESSRAH